MEDSSDCEIRCSNKAYVTNDFGDTFEEITLAKKALFQMKWGYSPLENTIHCITSKRGDRTYKSFNYQELNYNEKRNKAMKTDVVKDSAVNVFVYENVTYLLQYDGK